MSFDWQISGTATLPVIVLAAAFSLAATTARSQNQPTSPSPTAPFGTDWAKPNRGGYIYDDPRLRNQRPLPPVAPRPQQCPVGRMYDPVNQTCR